MNKENNIPDYRKLYLDILKAKYPEKLSSCEIILNKTVLSTADIIKLNKIIFGTKEHENNQKHKSYDRSTIYEILTYQRRHKCNNTQLASQFNLSRNTIANWKKKFLI